MKLRLFAFFLLSFTAISLSGCGGGDDDDNGRVRIVNASLDHAAIDVYFDDELKQSGVASGTVSGYMNYKKESQTLKVTRQGNTSAILETTVSPGGNTAYTYVVYGSEGNLRLSLYSENDSEAGSGKTKMRVINASNDVGAVDFFSSTSASSPSDLLARTSGIVPAAASAWVEIDKGSYRLWFTANGDKEDVRLATSAFNFEEKRNTTIVLLPTAGGALLNAMILGQERDADIRRNDKARLRLVAGLEGGERVDVLTDGTNRLISNASPSISNYILVDAAQTTFSITANGVPATSVAANLAAGTDNTLMVYGTASAANAKLISDNNRAITQSNRSRVRLVNGFTAAASPLTLSADFLPVASSVALGVASPYELISSGIYSRVEVNEGAATQPLFLSTDYTFQTGSVYSVFQLGSRANPVGIIRKDK